MGNRHAYRAEWLDYNQGIFFVTICSINKHHIFGRIDTDGLNHNELGIAAVRYIEEIPKHCPDVEIHNFVVMPNHVHILLQLVGTRHVASVEKNVEKSGINTGCLRPPRHGEEKVYNHFNSRLAVVIGSFKSAVTRYARTMRTRHVASLPQNNNKYKIWQERFHDHFVRDQFAYDNINNYITTNPINWKKDCFYE